MVFKIVRITAAIWQIHPFREGNTRSVIAFSVLLSAKLGVELDYEIFAQHAAYTRNALVWCTQGMYSVYEYLEKIYYDASGLLDENGTMTKSKGSEYEFVGDYRVSEYKEEPHIYCDLD